MPDQYADRRTRHRPEKPASRSGNGLSTRAEEIFRRRRRGRTEITSVRPVDPETGPFCDYLVTSSSGHTYRVEMRSLRDGINSCECPDHRFNRLGTCKHIEGARHHLFRHVTEHRASNRIEIFLDERNDQTLMLVTPEGASQKEAELTAKIKGYFSDLEQGSRDALGGLRTLAKEHPHSLRVSCRLEEWIDAAQPGSQRTRTRPPVPGRRRAPKKGSGPERRRKTPNPDNRRTGFVWEQPEQEQEEPAFEGAISLLQFISFFVAVHVVTFSVILVLDIVADLFRYWRKGLDYVYFEVVGPQTVNYLLVSATLSILILAWLKVVISGKCRFRGALVFAGCSNILIYVGFGCREFLTSG